MKRKEALEQGYRIEHGIIVSPGKFEGEPLIALHYYDLLMISAGTPIYPVGGAALPVDQSPPVVFKVTDEDRAEWSSDLEDARYAVLEEDSQGFVYLTLFDSLAELRARCEERHLDAGML